MDWVKLMALPSMDGYSLICWESEENKKEKEENEETPLPSWLLQREQVFHFCLQCSGLSGL